MPRGSGNRPPTPARRAPSLARAPGRPRSPSRGGPAHSGGRGTGNGVMPARGDNKSSSWSTARGNKLLRAPPGRRPEPVATLGDGPDVLLRQQRPYGGTSTGKGPPTAVGSAPVLPLLSGAGSLAVGQDRPERMRMPEKRGTTGKQEERGMRRPPQSYFFRKGEI